MANRNLHLKKRSDLSRGGGHLRRNSGMTWWASSAEVPTPYHRRLRAGNPCRSYDLIARPSLGLQPWLQSAQYYRRRCRVPRPGLRHMLVERVSGQQPRPLVGARELVGRETEEPAVRARRAVCFGVGTGRTSRIYAFRGATIRNQSDDLNATSPKTPTTSLAGSQNYPNRPRPDILSRPTLIPASVSPREQAAVDRFLRG